MGVLQLAHSACCHGWPPAHSPPEPPPFPAAGSDAFEGYVGVLQMAQSVTLAAEGAQPPSQQELQAKLAAFQQVRLGSTSCWLRLVV